MLLLSWHLMKSIEKLRCWKLLSNTTLSSIWQRLMHNSSTESFGGVYSDRWNFPLLYNHHPEMVSSVLGNKGNIDTLFITLVYCYNRRVHQYTVQFYCILFFSIPCVLQDIWTNHVIIPNTLPWIKVEFGLFDMPCCLRPSYVEHGSLERSADPDAFHLGFPRSPDIIKLPCTY